METTEIELSTFLEDQNIRQQILDIVSTSEIGGYGAELAIASAIIALLSLVGVIAQSVLMGRSLKTSLDSLKTSIDGINADHERSRREFAINLCREWSGGLPKEAKNTRDFVESLDEAQCRNLAKNSSFTVKADQIESLYTCLTHEFPTLEKDKLKADAVLEWQYVRHIRYVAVRYLNLIESIMLAWHHSVADRDIIEKEFEYLVVPKEGKNVMQSFRIALGEEAFHAIAAFVSELTKKNASGLPSKEKIVISGKASS